MTFSLFEIGSRSGRPVSLYEMTWGNTVWRYTNADRNIQWPYVDGDPENGTWWEAVPISDDGFTLGPQMEPMTVKLPVRLPVCQLFRSTPPALSIWLRVKRFHKDDPDQEGVTAWVGTIANIRRKGLITAELIGLSIGSTLKRAGNRLCWERGCPYALYDADCRVNKELFKTVATIDALTGTTITVDTLGAFLGTQYNGGFLEWEASVEGTIDRRGIQFFTGGTTFEVFGRTDRIEVGTTISMYLGCDLTAVTCDGTFDNMANHGGDEYIPGESPFDGRQLFY